MKYFKYELNEETGVNKIEFSGVTASEVVSIAVGSLGLILESIIDNTDADLEITDKEKREHILGYTLNLLDGELGKFIGITGRTSGPDVMCEQTNTISKDIPLE